MGKAGAAIPQAYEPALNMRLGELLSEAGLSSESEYAKPGSKSRIDVYVELPEGLTVAVECKNGWGATSKSQVLRDAKGRNGLAGSAVAVCYPEGTSRAEDLLPDSEILVSAINPDWKTQSDWTTTTPEGLAAMIRRLPEERDNPDYVANELKNVLTLATDDLSCAQKDQLAKALNMPAGKHINTAAIRGLLVVAAASMFHARLDDYLPRLKPKIDARDGKKFSDAWPPLTLKQCSQNKDILGSLEGAWELILAVDYKPVFETAITAITAPAQTHGLTNAVRKVVDKTLKLVSTQQVAWNHDLLGRIFHRVLDFARYDGSFYTSTAAATLLAGLAIPPLRSGSNQKLEDLRIVDPACGTGTLLMAAAARLQDIDGMQGSSTLLGKVLIEDVLHGYDINLTATHMAATTLGLMSPEVKSKRMNIHKFVFGIETGKAHVGSLELYTGEARFDEWPTHRQVDSGEKIKIEQSDIHDLVIMNPPYTRDSLRYDQFTDWEERAMKQREKEIFGSTPAHLSGTTGMFLLLADKLADRTDGCVAVVLPASVAGAPSAGGVWERLLKNFWVETVVASHDPARMFFSENTKISEILIVLRRSPRTFGWEPPDANYIRLSVNPDLPTQTLPIYNAYHDGKIDEVPNVSVYRWPQHKLQQNDWLPSKFFSNYLVKTVEDWFAGGQIETRLLGDLADIGPAGQAVRGCFKKSDTSDTKGRQALWNNDTSVTKQMLAKPDTYLKPQTGKEAQAKNLWSKRGRLLIPTRFSTPSMLLGAVWSETPILGSGWVPVKHNTKTGDKETEWEKAVCVWLNSTFGILAQLCCATPKKLVFPAISIDGQRRIPTPDFTTEQVTQLAKVFDDNASKRHQRLALPDGTVREILDQAVAETLGITEEQANKIRSELAKEPSITNERYKSPPR